MIFCQSVNAVLVISALLGGGNRGTLTNCRLNLFAIKGSGDTKALLSNPRA